MIVRWSNKAKARLQEIHDFIAADAPLRAGPVIKRLLLRGRSLAVAPRADRRVPEYAEDDLREVLERPYRIIYRVSGDRIEILTVKHYRQRLPVRPRNL
jgi:plasmid stabilization system protein ParE